MRRQRLLRTSSTQSLCIFCACRLTGDLPTVASRPLFTQQQRRGLANTNQPFQGFQPAAIPSQGNDIQNPNSPQWTGFDPKSSLSASEQREKAALRQRREAAEQARREEAEHTAAEERARRDVKDRRRWEQDQARLQAHQREQQRAQQRDKQQDAARRTNVANPQALRSEVAPTRGFYNLSLNGSRREEPSSPSIPSGNNSKRPADGEETSKPRNSTQSQQNDRSRRDFNEERSQRPMHSAHPKHDSRSSRDTNEVGPHRQAVGRNGPVKPASKPEMLPERVTTPNFLKSGSARPAPTPEPVASGWGSGATERKALLYGEELPEQKVHEEYGIPGLRDIGYSQNSNIHDTPVEPQSRNGGFGVQNSETRDDSTYTPGYTEHFDTVHTNAQNWSISRPTPPEGTQRPLEASPPPPPGPEPTKHTNPDARSIQDVLSTASGSRFSKQQSNTPWMQEQASVEGQAFGQSDRYRSPPPVERPTEQLDQVERHPVSEPAFGEQRPAYRTHESGKKKPAYRTNGQNGYRVTPFNPNDCSGNHKTADQAPQSNWQHLSRRKPEPASQAPPPPPPVRQSPVYSEEDVDRLFSQHREERMQRAPPPPPPVYSSYRPPVREDRARNTPWLQDGFEPEQAARPPPRPRDAPTVCGRCRQEGHHARECPGQKCNHCGQLGHLSRNCPTSYGRTTGVCSVRLDLPEGERAGPRRTEYSFTPDRQRGDHFEDERPARNSRNGWQRPAREDRGSDDPRQMMMERVLQSESAGEEDEEPEERVLKSRKFRDEEPEKDKKKPGRRSRDEEDEDDYNDRRSRRGRRDFDDEEGDSRPSRKSNKNGEKEAQKRAERAAERAAQRAEQRNQIKLPQFISVQNLAQALGVRYEQFVNRLEDLGYDDVFPGKILNTEISGMIAMEYDLEAVYDTGISEEEERDLKARPEVDPQDKDYLPTRPPVVTIMGHVDHGKTTILDYLRKSSVAAGEAGGITQHIGAFSVPLAASGKTVTFLDTPGHAAFLAMRQRGANVTDIVILVVAADDSVKPQTLEAIKHAKAAGVPMIVAVNKIDKEEADVQRVKQDLARHGVEIEDFGGETQVVLVSGKTGQGMDELEEAAVTLSEILDHRAEADGAVEGWVLEATTKKAGRVATVLVRRGTLRQGAVIVAGKTWARVRSLRNEAGVVINEASPGMPVEVDGWRDQPAAGDEVLQAPTEQKATSVVEYRLEKDEREKTAADMEAINEARRLEQAKREREQAKLNSTSSEDPASITTTSSSISSDQDPASTGKQEIPFIIKADVSGSAEAVSAYILSISSPLIGPRVLSSSVGSIHESDIELASAADGHIIAFNLPPNEGMKGQAEARGVKVLENNIIYRVLDDVRAVLEEKLPPVVTQRVLGEAEVAASFEIGIGGRKKMVIAGCKVRNGLVSKGARVRVTRGGEKVYDGLITSLKNVKKDVTEMRKGSECGMGFGDGWEGFETGDQVQTYEERSERRKL